jgi:hypothetical protein
MGRHAKKTTLIKQIFGKTSGWAKYGFNTPIVRGFICSDCSIAGIVLSNKKTGTIEYVTCDCVGDPEKLIRVA